MQKHVTTYLYKGGSKYVPRQMFIIECEEYSLILQFNMCLIFSSPGIDFASTQIGTPINICPEIVSGQPYDFKSDIWSLGCVTYEICSQRPAFQGEWYLLPGSDGTR